MLLRNGTGWKMLDCDFDNAGRLSIADEVKDEPAMVSLTNTALGINLQYDKVSVYHITKLNMTYIVPSAIDTSVFDDNGGSIVPIDVRYSIENWMGLGALSYSHDWRAAQANKKISITKNYTINDEDSPATRMAKSFLNCQTIDIYSDAKTVQTFNSINADIMTGKLSFNKFISLVNLMSGAYAVRVIIDRKEMTPDGGYIAKPVTSITL
ncbi:MAG: hypothetical protein ACRCZ9_12100 [Fusobacteriaceae bacterium]